jgi:hypothetical protein
MDKHLARLPADLRASVEEAALACNTPERLAEAARLADDERRRRRSEMRRGLMRLANAAILRKYGVAAAQAASAILASGSTDDHLMRIGKIVSEARERKRQNYRRKVR